MTADVLTWADVRSIERQVLRRLRKNGDRHVVAVGVGIKNAHRRPKRRRLAAVLVVVRRVPEKRLPKKIRMGKSRRVQVDIGSGARRRRLLLATDVIPVKKAIPVAARTESGIRLGSAGALIFWIQGGRRYWGLVTAGHAVDRTSGTVLLSPTFGDDVFGDGHYRSVPGDPYDVAVIKIREADVASFAPGVAALDDPQPLDVRGFAALASDNLSDADQGVCLTPDGIVAFDTELALAGPVDWVSGYAGLKNVLRVRALPGSGSQPFRPGTSGSAWVHLAMNVPMAILVAAEPTAFTVGIGQALAPILSFVKTRLGASELRLVHIF